MKWNAHSTIPWPFGSISIFFFQLPSKICQGEGAFFLLCQKKRNLFHFLYFSLIWHNTVPTGPDSRILIQKNNQEKNCFSMKEKKLALAHWLVFVCFCRLVDLKSSGLYELARTHVYGTTGAGEWTSERERIGQHYLTIENKFFGQKFFSLAIGPQIVLRCYFFPGSLFLSIAIYFCEVNLLWWFISILIAWLIVIFLVGLSGASVLGLQVHRAMTLITENTNDFFISKKTNPFFGTHNQLCVKIHCPDGGPIWNYFKFYNGHETNWKLCSGWYKRK